MDIKNITPEEALDIRHQVLWPNKPKEFCKLEDDYKGIHYGGFLNGKLVCVASIFIENNSARLRKFATLTEFQGKGYGTLLIKHIISDLKGTNATGLKPVVTPGTNATGLKPVVTPGTNATGLKPVVTPGTNATGLKPVVTHLWCDARITAKDFYNRFKMSSTGETFFKSDVEYIVMERKIKSSL
ncbi:N-acetyltransferase [Thiospirochaeta perfilievii]|uniref:N-acetyltransferase n=1 Tax=Thiospirochaeta perfilievii TaxID=252967 RepID=A0A5C1Q7S2_9SPIO|nr:GNAT family N-acetyltransferase [Thiospirochaeta perfilievii]QEN04123.1 N-acetyltransferase [Thiospirochaeta perfilievii]